MVIAIFLPSAVSSIHGKKIKVEERGKDSEQNVAANEHCSC